QFTFSIVSAFHKFIFAQDKRNASVCVPAELKAAARRVNYDRLGPTKCETADKTASFARKIPPNRYLLS
ncbi:MAG: hypothetical protein ACI9G1_005466, partial [Pirellulaceae bacterium]